MASLGELASGRNRQISREVRLGTGRRREDQYDRLDADGKVCAAVSVEMPRGRVAVVDRTDGNKPAQDTTNDRPYPERTEHRGD